MSTRFYINGVQVFGNGDMYENTRQELIKQIGHDPYEEDYFYDKKIKDPDALLTAIENDIKELILGENETKDDSDLFKGYMGCSTFWLDKLREGKANHNFLNICLYFIDVKTFFIPLVAYMAMEDKIEKKDGKFVLKKNRVVKVSWY